MTVVGTLMNGLNLMCLEKHEDGRSNPYTPKYNT